MAIPSRQIGWSDKSNMLWSISKQLDILTCLWSKISITTSSTTTSTSISSTSTSSTTTTTTIPPICNNYGVVVSTGTLSEGGNSIGLYDDDGSLEVALPFSFYFFDTLYNSVYITTNGYITFDGGTVEYEDEPFPTLLLTNAICALWSDLSVAEAGDIYSQTIGITPNRCFIIRFDTPTVDLSTDITEHFEIRLYETSNNIKIVYGAITETIANAVVGIQKDNGELVYYQYTDPISEGVLIRYEYCQRVEPTTSTTTSTTTLASTSTTSTTGIPITTTTTTTAIPSLDLTWDNIANVPVADASSVSDWNTFFDLPTNGTVFTGVDIIGNVVSLLGGSNITLRESIFDNVENYGASLISVVDNNCVIAVGIGAFAMYNSTGCPNLITVDLPVCLLAEVTAFYACRALITGNFPSLTQTNDWCFDECWSMTNVDFSSLVTANYGSFYWCSSLVNPSFPSLTFAGEQCFELCTSLINPSFPLLSVAGERCFMDNSLLTSDFPSLTTTGQLCFKNCIGLIDPDFSSLILAAGECFRDCTGFVNPSFPSLTTIGSQCFRGDYNITSLNIPICIQLGDSTGYNYMFTSISEQTVTLTIPTALMTCDGGNPDGDIVYLQANNTVTIITV